MSKNTFIKTMRKRKGLKTTIIFFFFPVPYALFEKSPELSQMGSLHSLHGLFSIGDFSY
jgi:hypothetical protein